MKKKILAVMLASAMTLQCSAWAAAEEVVPEEGVIISELDISENGEISDEEESLLDIEAEDIFLAPDNTGGGANQTKQGSSALHGEEIPDLREEEADAVELSIEEVDLVEDPGYNRIQEETEAQDVEINEENFPDEIFRGYVEQFDADSNGIIEASEIKEVTEIDVSEEGIGNLKGIEYFPFLTILSCDGNQLSSLDVSGNPALEYLYCYSNQLSDLDVSGNPALEYLDCSLNQLSDLDVSGNPSLTELDCSSNQLSSLDVSRNPSLTELKCDSNQLGSLDLSGNPYLEYLNCLSNQLSSLDVSGNPSLEYLDCDSNQLSSLDVSGNPSLSNLYCSSNQLSSLDVSGNPSLSSLSCSSNQLSSLDVSGNPSLSSLSCDSNQLSSLDVSGNPSLGYLDCDSNQLSSLDVSGNPSLSSLYCYDNWLSSLDLSNNLDLTSFIGDGFCTVNVDVLSQMDDTWQMNLAAYVGSANLDRVTIVSEGASLSGGIVLFGDTKPEELVYQYDTKAPGLSEEERKMEVTVEFSGSVECEHEMVTVVDKEPTCAPGIQHRECSICGYEEAPTEIPAVREHSFGPYVVTKEATEKEEGLKTRTCTVCGQTESVSIPYQSGAEEQDVEINEENFPDEIFRGYVEQFDADSNEIIEANEIKEVTEIDVSEKGIGNLKGVEYFPFLITLSCDGNKLDSLDVSGNPALEYLDCSLNQLSSLDVSGNLSLKYLDCESNQLNSLDVSKNSSLSSLYCSSNQLSSLDVSENPSLNSLFCYDNQLSSLDVSGNPVLEYLNCYSNQLSNLDVSGNPVLEYLSCSLNQLSNLDVSGNTSLTEMYCDSNQLSSLDVSRNLSLEYLDCESNQLSSLDVSGNPSLGSLYCYDNRLSSLDLSNNLELTSFIGDGSCTVNADVLSQTDGIWQMNLAAYVGSANLDRVTIVSEGASLSGEMILFGDTKPKELVYQYDTKAPGLSEEERKMEVTVEFSGAVECEHEMVTVVDKEPTCAPGIQHRECSICGYEEAPTEIPAVREHSFGPYVVTKEATEEEEGLKTRTCTVCGQTESVSIPYQGGAEEQDVEINEENFPDEIFRGYVEQFDADSNGVIEASEIKKVTLIDVSEEGIGSLKGIEYFPFLTTLFCDGNQLSSLDVSGNPALEYLDCYSNQLSSLDVSGNPSLSNLDCYSNQLSSLDVSGNPSLSSLDCSLNQLNSLDLSNNLELASFLGNGSCTVNADVLSQTDGIWQMNLAAYVGSANLDRVTIVSEGASLSEGMVLFGDVRPEELVYQYDTKAPGLSEEERKMEVTVEFSGDVECEHEMVTVVDKEPTCAPGIQHRECSICGYKEAPTEIPAVREHSFGPYVVTKEATEEEEGLKTRTCTVCGQTESVSIPYQDQTGAQDVEINEENFPDEIFRGYVEKFDDNSNGIIEASEIIEKVAAIDVTDKGIESLKGIEYFPFLTTLSCGGNQLNSLDVSGNPALQQLDCFSNQLSELDVSGNPALQTLNCFSNQLIELDVSGNPALEYLNCSKNQLSELDVSENPSLISLNCSSNQINSLDVSGNPFLTDLVCTWNQLSELDVSGNPSLSSLNCYGNQLSSLDMSGNPSLTELYCGSNPLSSLDLSSNLQLTLFDGEGSCTADTSVLSQTNGIWQMNLAAYVGSANLDRVTIVSKGASLSGEMVLFGDVKPEELDYQYDTKAPGLSEERRKMNVTIEFSDADECEHEMVTVVDKEPTCAPGIQHRECSICGYEEAPTEIPAVSEHSFGPYVVTKEATAEEEGLQVRTCAVCGQTESAVIPKTGTDAPGTDTPGTDTPGIETPETSTPGTDGVCAAHEMITVVDKQAGCGTPGSQHRECRICGYKEAPTEIPATGQHTFGSYVMTKEATVLEEGVRTRTCAVCGKTERAEIPKVRPQAKVNASEIPMQAGQATTKLEVSGLADGDRVVSWSSSDKKIVKVTKQGKLKAKKTGTAVVTVTLASGLTKKIEVTVQKAKVKTAAISGLSKNVTLKKGKKLTLKPVITPITSQDKVSYKSSNEKVAAVTAKGVIKAKNPGTTKITVTSGKKKVTVTVKVKK